MSTTPLFAVRQSVFTEFRPIAEHIFPIVHGEKAVIPSPVDGFMMYFCPASQLLADSGQHCCEASVDADAQVSAVQSCTAPKV